ncbi:MAG: hypothetical protein Kow0013_17690 [Pararhodobacter sp.]
MSGRRVYVHAHSLRALCLSDRQAGEEIIGALIGVGVKKRLFNRLVQDGRIVLGLDEGALEPVRCQISDLDGTNLTRVMRRVLYRPAVNGQSRAATPARPLFERDEDIVASCFDDNYYTFATDRDAADRMYADRVPIKDLRRLMAEAPDDPRVADLTLVRGKRLSLAPHPDPEIAPVRARLNERLTPPDLEAVARSAQARAASLTERFLGGLDRALFPEPYLGMIRESLIESLADSARPVWSGRI